MKDRSEEILWPSSLRPGDRVRFVSPASTPDKAGVLHRSKILESWGLQVDFGAHVFDERGFLAGRDEDRLADFNGALRDPAVRAIFATRGGKGSYRIADALDFDAARRDPKFVVGFSDITALHLSLWKHCRLAGIHGGLSRGDLDVDDETVQALRRVLMEDGRTVLDADASEPTADFTTAGSASGPLLGGNLQMIATAAGWALPDLTGAILLIEAVDMPIGLVDRNWITLEKSGVLDGIAGVAFGQFHRFRTDGAWTVFDYLKENLTRLDVPILGGLPLGHRPRALPVPVGAQAHLDASAGTLTVEATAVRSQKRPAPRTSPSARHPGSRGNPVRA